MNKTKLSISLVAFTLVVGGIFVFVFKSQSAKVAVMPVLKKIIPTVIVSIPSTITSRYKNGTYSVTGNYDSPAGAEGIVVSVTLTDDIIVDSSVTALANDSRSQNYQALFISGYKSYVIGKSIDSIRLDHVSGSSLTPAGFNNALDKIKTEAKA